MNIEEKNPEEQAAAIELSKQKLKKAVNDLRLSPEMREELVEAVVTRMHDRFIESGGQYYPDINDVLKALPNITYIARREDPENVIDLISEDKDLKISFGDDKFSKDRYLNSVAWGPDEGVGSLKDAFIEGHGKLGNIVTVMGFETSNDLDVQILDESKTISHGRDRTRIRSTSGTVHPEDTRFVFVRVPAAQMPDHLMTDEEIDNFEDEMEKPKAKRGAGLHIIRAYIFDRPGESNDAAA
ncbi:hypothetical protein HQ524_02085 [Candidatus Uhrbacteria bacterium]|nr:hypothetical protein [Candidatus Uhrbacteria bacterium]